jgi:broad specificity polyphosphatase/5'/3'-nucleotidase SurE
MDHFSLCQKIMILTTSFSCSRQYILIVVPHGMQSWVNVELTNVEPTFVVLAFRISRKCVKTVPTWRTVQAAG